ncbi:MAG: hypothetical protein ACK5MD_08885 [Flavobacteriales bacterium]
MKYLLLIILIYSCKSPNQVENNSNIGKQNTINNIQTNSNDFGKGKWYLADIKTFKNDTIASYYKKPSFSEVRNLFSDSIYIYDNFLETRDCKIDLLYKQRSVSNDLFFKAEEYEKMYQENLKELFNISLEDSVKTILNKYYNESREYSSSIESNKCNVYKSFWVIGDTILTTYYNYLVLYNKNKRVPYKANESFEIKVCSKKIDSENFTFTEKCEYSGITDFKLLYKNMIDTYEIESALEELPKKDTSFSTTTALEFKYVIQKDTIKISQFFEAGENHYLIYNKGGNGIVEQIAMPD